MPVKLLDGVLSVSSERCDASPPAPTRCLLTNCDDEKSYSYNFESLFVLQILLQSRAMRRGVVCSETQKPVAHRGGSQSEGQHTKVTQVGANL